MPLIAPDPACVFMFVCETDWQSHTLHHTSVERFIDWHTCSLSLTRTLSFWVCVAIATVRRIYRSVPLWYVTVGAGRLCWPLTSVKLRGEGLTWSLRALLIVLSLTPQQQRTGAAEPQGNSLVPRAGFTFFLSYFHLSFYPFISWGAGSCSACLSWIILHHFWCYVFFWKSSPCGYS